VEINNTDAHRIVEDAFMTDDGGMANRRDAWKLYYAYYNQQYPDPEEESQYTNNSFDPVIAEKVETYRPFMCRRIPDLQHVPRAGSTSDKARKHEIWQRYMWYVQRMKAKRQKISWYCGLFGSAVIFQFYRKDEEEVWTRTFDKEGQVTEKTETKTVYDDPDCEVVDILYDFIPDGIGTDIDSCRRIIHLQYMTPEKARKLTQGKDPWFHSLPDDLEDYYGPNRREDRLNELDRFKDSHNLGLIVRGGLVEVMNYWEDDRLIIELNRHWTARDSGNPFKALRKKKPFTLFKFLDDPTQFWGKGLGDLCVKTQHTANVLERLKIDSAKRSLRPVSISPLGAGVDPSPLYEGERYNVESPSPSAPVQFIPTPDLSTIGLATQVDIRNRADSVSGAPPLFSGMTSGGDKSATENRLMQSNLMQRAFYVLGNMDAGFAEWMLKNVAMAAQFYPFKKDIRVVNDQGGLIEGTLTYDDIVSGVDVEVKTNSGQPITADDRSLQADAMLARFGQDPWTRPRDVRVAAAKMYELPLDPDKMFITEQEMSQAQQAQEEKALALKKMENDHEIKMAMARAMFKNGAEPEEELAPPAGAAPAQTGATQ